MVTYIVIGLLIILFVFFSFIYMGRLITNQEYIMRVLIKIEKDIEDIKS